MTSYDATPARHSVTGALVKGARGTLHTEADYATLTWDNPVTITPVGAAATTELVADAYGLFPQFDDPAHSKTLIFRDLEGGHIQRLYSIGWLLDEVTGRLAADGLAEAYRGGRRVFELWWDDDLTEWVDDAGAVLSARPTVPAGYERLQFCSPQAPAAANPYSAGVAAVGDLWWFAQGGGPFA